MADDSHTGEVRPDPGGVQTAIDRYRDLAKYLITIFAGVGALLVAGTQLASIGRLSLEDEPERVLAVLIGLTLAVGAIAVIVGLALKILRPIEMTFDEVVKDPKLAVEINKRTSLLGGAGSVREVSANVTSHALLEEDIETWIDVTDDITAEAAYLRMRETFDSTWRPLLGAAVAGVIGITAFTWGANPPDDARLPAQIVKPAPASVKISLTADGRDALTDALGGNTCADGPISALSIGGSEGAPQVVTLPHGSCKAAQFVLSATWGAAQSPSEPHGGHDSP
jgi:hypothetical protein